MVRDCYLEKVDTYMNMIINKIKMNLTFYKPKSQMLNSLVALTSLDVGYSKHTHVLCCITTTANEFLVKVMFS